MSIRPIDSLTLLPTLNQANRLQHEKQFQPMLMQRVQDVVAEAKNDRAQNQVKAKENAEHAQVQKDGKGKSDGGAPRRPRKGQPDAKADRQEQQSQSQNAGHHLDVKV